MKILVLGGGTAGWLTALWCRSFYPSDDITLLESSEVGTVGVGEGTTPWFLDFLKELDISPLDVLQKTNGSIKQGISFENWNGDSGKFFHGFQEQSALTPCEECFYDYIRTVVKNNLDMNEYNYSAKLSYQNKVDINNLQMSLHFDAGKLLDYLKYIGSQRNIVCIDGKFSHPQVNEQDYITKLCLEDGSELPCDFVFDCSGFARLLIGKYYKVNWISYQDFLPMKKAIAFPLDPEDDIKPYTRAIAMKYGWMWNIPLQDRIGAGYVFDSDFLTDDEALDEVEQLLEKPISNVRSIPFNAGRYEKYWVKNCIAVGLASSFIEPLEATSLSHITRQLRFLEHTDLKCYPHTPSQNVEIYNQAITADMDSIARFLYLHYITKRQDTEFWKTLRQRHVAPLELDKIVKFFQGDMDSFLTSNDVQHALGIIDLPKAELYTAQVKAYCQCKPLFGMLGYFLVSSGLGILSPIFRQSLYTSGDSCESQKQLIDDYVSMADTHQNFLKMCV